MRHTSTPNEIQSVAKAIQPRREVPGLTGLRFVAAFSVAMAHGSELILKFDSPSLAQTRWLPPLAGLGMGLFFVLSGFVIHYNYRIAVTQGGIDGLGGFIWARFSRLYPLFFLIVTLDVLLGKQLFYFMSGNTDAFTDVLHALPYYLTFTQSWIYKPFPGSSLIYVTGANASLTWSISTEWFFYLSYPLVALFVIRARGVGVTIVAALTWCALWIVVASTIFDHGGQIDAWAANRYGSIAGLANGNQDSYFRWLMYFSPYLRIGEFILGCIVAQLYIVLQGKDPSGPERFIGQLLLALGILSVPVLTYMMYSDHGRVLAVQRLNMNFGLAPSVALIIFCSARYDTLFTRILKSRPFEALGDASYSIYLIHFLIFTLAASFLSGVLPATGSNIAFLFGKYIFILGLILLLSLGLHAFFEVPAREWLRGLWRDRSAERKRLLAYSLLASPGVAAVLIMLATSLSETNTTSSVTSGIRVLSATYGANCQAQAGNSTRAIGKSCNGKENCNYIVDVNILGDPASGCAKGFSVDYQCAPDEKRLTKSLPAEAGLKSPLYLSCAAGQLAKTELSPLPTPAPVIQNLKTLAEDIASDGEIQVQSATFGGNCGALGGNATSDVQMTCDGERKCTYMVDVERLGNPVPDCAKAFVVEYQCTGGGPPVKAEIPGEAGFNKPVRLSCQSVAEGQVPAVATWNGIRVLSSTYGANCGARIGNATVDIEKVCDKKISCDYTVDVRKLGDPAQGCAKSFFVKYQCGGASAARTSALPGEAGLGGLIHLSCP